MSRRAPIRLALALAAALAALLACAGPALAGRAQQSFFQDDRLLTGSDEAVQAQALDSLAGLGVDTIRTVVNWRRFAPSPDALEPPAGFDGSDPKAYPPAVWDAYDSLVRGAQARGISVLMSPAGPVPNWASNCGRNVNLACRPSPKQYGRFVRALGTRYSGSYADENQGGGVLPRVARWSVWNEPNLGAWLYPQTKPLGRGRRRPVGAARYRRLVYAARAALDATGHGDDRVLIGETAPIGGGTTRTPPADFLRQLFCMNRKGRRLRGRRAKHQGCRKAKRIDADGIAHHPYARGAGVPTGRRQRRGSITIGTIGRFLPLIRAARHSRVAPRRLPVYITEFGVTTEPPDTKFGVSVKRQAQYLNLVDYLAFRRPWIKSVSQFQLVDDTGLAERGTFQTGLVFRTGVLKPSFQAYRIPIFVIKRHRRVRVFGQVRPIRAGAAPATVQIQNHSRSGWHTVASRRTNERGYVLAKLRRRPGRWRIRWVEPSGLISFSRGSPAVFPTTPSTPGLPPPGAGTPPSPDPPSSDPGTPPPGPSEPPAPPPPVRFTLAVALELHDNLLMQPAAGHVTSAPAGIDCTGGPSGCAADYDQGTSVVLTAQPDPGSRFDGWSGEGCTGTDTCAVTLSKARSVTASFTRNFP